MQKTVYQTNQRGEYICPIVLSKEYGDIGIDGEWLVPGGCIEIAPPAIGENQKAVWNGATWSVEDISVEPDPEPEAEPTPQELKQQAVANLNAEYLPQIDALLKAYSLAQMDGDTPTAEEIQAEYISLRQEYNTKMEVISNA